jgi:SPP1 family predicted phage head-tail adaptor
MGLDRGALNKRIVILRPELIDDGEGRAPGIPVEIGRRWAKKTDVSDGERVRAAENGQTITSRFLVQRDPLTETITGKDLIAYKGRSYEITGTKDVDLGGDDAIEITAAAREDVA